MIEKDTVRLLRECDAGVKMGIDSIEQVIGNVKSEDFKCILGECKREHKALESEILSLLDGYGDEGKKPNPITKATSHVMTEMKMLMNGGDGTIADLMTDGCNMGVKSLNKYLNEYKAASERSKDVTKKLINLEEKLAVDIRGYL